MSCVALNLMMGTYSIKAEQVLASLRPSKDGSDAHLMDIRIVINRDSEDIIRIQKKTGCRTCYNTVIKVELTNHNELRDFINARRHSLRQLDRTINLPMTKIGYSVPGRYS